MSQIDRLAFYNAYDVWKENMGEREVNLRDIRYGFSCQITQAMREFARRAMSRSLKNFRQWQIDSLVENSHFMFPGKLFLLFRNTNTCFLNTKTIRATMS